MNHRRRQRAVTARPHLEKHIRMAADPNAPRVNNYGFHSARPSGDDVVRKNERRRARVVTPEQESFAVREIRRREIGAKGKAEAGVSVSVADVGCRKPVRTAQDIEETREPPAGITD